MPNYTWPTRSSLSLALAAALLFTFSCGGSQPMPTRNSYAYVAVDGNFNASSSALAQFRVTNNGTLAPLSPAAFTSGGRSLAALVVDPSGKYLFTGDEIQGTINQFVIGDDGTITPNSVPSVTTDGPPASMTFTPNGQFVIVQNGFSLSAYNMNPAGSLTLTSTTPALGGFPVVHPAGQFFYVADDSGNSSISQYTISANGTIAPVSTLPLGDTGPSPLVISPTGFLYSADGGTGTVTEFSINASDGSLAKVNSVPSGSGGPSGAINASWPCSIAFHPTGAYVYVSNCLDSTVSQFTVDASTGTLARNGSDISLGAPLDEARDIVVDPSGHFLFAACDSGTVLGFTIDRNGMLTSNGTVSLANYGSAFAIVIPHR